MIMRVECGIAGKAFSYEYLEWIRKVALKFGLTGEAFLKNDGSIDIIAEGEETFLKKFVDKMERGHFWHQIENFYSRWSGVVSGFSDFSISEEYNPG